MTSVNDKFDFFRLSPNPTVSNKRLTSCWFNFSLARRILSLIDELINSEFCGTYPICSFHQFVDSFKMLVLSKEL